MMPVSARTSSQSRPQQFPSAMPRIIQITAIPESDDHSVVLFALTENGEIYENVFRLTVADWNGWQLVPWVPAICDRFGNPL